MRQHVSAVRSQGRRRLVLSTTISEPEEDHETGVVGQKTRALQPKRERRCKQEMNQRLLSRASNQEPDPQRGRCSQGSGVHGTSSVRGRSPGRGVLQE